MSDSINGIDTFKELYGLFSSRVGILQHLSKRQGTSHGRHAGDIFQIVQTLG